MKKINVILLWYVIWSRMSLTKLRILWIFLTNNLFCFSTLYCATGGQRPPPNPSRNSFRAPRRTNPSGASRSFSTSFWAVHNAYCVGRLLPSSLVTRCELPTKSNLIMRYFFNTSIMPTGTQYGIPNYVLSFITQNAALHRFLENFKAELLVTWWGY